jgi:hypothetical protein
MKSFSSFLTEATQSQAAMQAKRLGLKGDGHGGWYNHQGEFIAKTEKGELKFYTKGQKVGQKDTPNSKTDADQRVAATQVSSRPLEEPQSQQQTTEPEKPKEGATLTIVFGRFNPPTVGHEKLLNSASRVSVGGELKIYPSRTKDPKKNPLDPNTKISYMRKMFPKYGENIVNDDEMKSIFDVLKAADSDGYSAINIVVGSDRQSEFDNLANKYNGDLYDFEEIKVISAGARDADSGGVEGMSASKMRKAALDDDFKTFRSGIPKSLNDEDTKKLFNTLRKSMKVGLKEDLRLWEIAPKIDWKNLRDNYIQNNIFTIGDIVENLNTGLVGKVTRRGTNHLICVSNEGIMFKSWIKDVNEWTEVSGVPASQREVGTDSLRKYAMKMTHTNKIQNFNIRQFINKYKEKKVSTY